MKPFDPIDCLTSLIKLPSFSKVEEATAEFIEQIFVERNIPTQRIQNNIIVQHGNWKEGRSIVLLNSHHDTVKPNSGYTNDPFQAILEDGKLYGLGSNDAGGSLVALISTFLKLYAEELPFNLLFIASAEEEISGRNGIELAVQSYSEIDLAIIGEPTSMKAAIAEKGLAVFDAVAKGKSGHVAHGNTINPIQIAASDIMKIHAWQCEKPSEVLGNTILTVSSIEAPSAHNVVPADCKFIVDARINEQYTIQEIEELLNKMCASTFKARSMRLQPSKLEENHPFFTILKEAEIEMYGSPTLSDQALLNCPSLKIGPGDSLRSHTADEYIHTNEIIDAIGIYTQLLITYKNYYETVG